MNSCLIVTHHSEKKDKVPTLQSSSTLYHILIPNTTANMVHLGRVKTDKDLSERVLPGFEGIDLNAPGDDDFTASVYGSRFAATDIPKHEMPEEEMPKEIAYRLIK